MKISKCAVAAATVLATLGVFGGSASAGDGCAARTTTAAFAQWGDTNQYFTATNGTFESGAGGWALRNGTSVVADQAPWKVNGSNHGRALNLPGGSSATSTSMCVASNEESMRFFYKSPGSGSLQVRVEVSNARGSSVRTWSVSTSRTGWIVSPQLALPNLRDANGQQWITVTFSSSGSAAWAVDDVMIDPWITR
jgi:hypothetical protein